MKLACIYINALHFRDTVSFYEQLLQQKGKEVTAQRWVELSCGHTRVCDTLLAVSAR